MVSEKYERHELHLPHKQRRVGYLDFEIVTTHQTERVFATNHLNLYVDLVQHVSLLKKYVCV